VDRERELWESLVRGEPDAVARLFHRHAGRMVGFARRFVADPAAAEDVVADLFERWLRRPPPVREHERLGAFLATSVHHAAVDWIRRERAAQGVPPRGDRAEPQPDRRRKQDWGVAPGGDLQTRLAAALGRMSDSDRLLLETHYGHALSPEECATIMRISRDAFHQRLHRARVRLSDLLNAAGEAQ
jgi:RNA polymerase sigma-70 factor, ECF subfamily